ncbi:MAG: lipopolysaccharide transport periplasmic protein LptA [Gammaproteobacteria bacterium]
MFKGSIHLMRDGVNPIYFPEFSSRAAIFFSLSSAQAEDPAAFEIFWIPAYAGMTRFLTGMTRVFSVIKRYSLKTIFTTILFSLLPITSFSLESDSTKPMHIHADTLNSNYKQGVNVFHGDAVATQGTTSLSGDTIIALTNEKHKVTRIIATGSSHHQAHYRTIQKAGEPEFNAYADTITYYMTKKIAKLNGHAHVSKNKNSFNGPNITYNMATQEITSKSSKTNRSTLILYPGN